MRDHESIQFCWISSGAAPSSCGQDSGFDGLRSSTLLCKVVIRWLYGSSIESDVDFGRDPSPRGASCRDRQHIDGQSRIGRDAGRRKAPAALIFIFYFYWRIAIRDQRLVRFTGQPSLLLGISDLIAANAASCACARSIVAALPLRRRLTLH